MELNKKIVLFCVIIQLLFCEVHPVPDGPMNETKGDFGPPGGLGGDRDSKGGMESLPPTKSTHQTSTPATLASQPISINFTSAERNQTGSEGGDTLLAPSGGNQTLPGYLGKTNMTHGDDDVIVTSNMTSPGDTITSAVTLEEGGEEVTTLPDITYPDAATGNATNDDNNSTGVVPVGTGTLLPVPAGTLPPGDTGYPAVPGISPEVASSNSSSSSSIANSLQPTQLPGGPVVSTLPPVMVGSTTLPPPMYRRTTTDSAAGGMVRRTTLQPPATTTTETRRAWFRTTAPHPPPTTVTTTTMTTPRSSTHTHHSLLPPRRPAGGGAADEGVQGDSTSSEDRGEIAGMDPLALGIGICIPVLLIIVVILSVFCYRKYKKGGRGYITLDDFGTFEGMQNPNYDGEL